jgi:5-oxoprolinase (ATP-hydrolysing)
MLGKIQPHFFPAGVRPRGDAPLDAQVVERKFAALADDIRRSTGNDRTPSKSPKAI